MLRNLPVALAVIFWSASAVAQYPTSTTVEELAREAADGAAFDAFIDAISFSYDDAVACMASSKTEPGRRERTVTQYVPLVFNVDDDRVVRVTVEGATDEEQVCLDELFLSEGEPTVVPDSVDVATPMRYRVDYYDSTYREQQQRRQHEVIALYTVSATTAAFGIGAFIAARRDADYVASLDGSSSPSPVDRNLRDRPDRYRKAAWSMIGVSLASFVGGTLLFERHRDIERAQNPVLVVRPGAVGADAGISFEARF